MKKEICNFILKNSELLEGMEEDNNIVIYALDLDKYDEETESFYRVVDYKGIKKSCSILGRKVWNFLSSRLFYNGIWLWRFQSFLTKLYC